MDERQEIERLRLELEQANYEYYVLDNPTMSDYDFDHKLRRLEELEAAHPELASPDSPTQRVGGKVAEGFQEVVHRVPLELSLIHISAGQAGSGGGEGHPRRGGTQGLPPGLRGGGEECPQAGGLLPGH